jgi:uncharacterized protein involved in exopolysaccharide biosynthesis
VEVSEVAARLFRRYLPILLLSTVVPMIALGGFVMNQPRTYTAHARLVAAPVMPRTQAEAAAAVSQATAIVTSPDVVSKVLADSKVVRDIGDVVKAVSVTGLGSSALADIAYRDPDPSVAQKVTAGLATAVAAKLDAIRTGLSDVLKVVDDELVAIAAERASVQALPKDPGTQARLDGLDRLVSDITATRGRLTSVTPVASGHSSVISMPSLPTQPDSRGLPTKLGLAAILGLAIALLLVGINETFRPAVSGAFRVGRLLEVPVLGQIAADPAALADLGRRIRLAARRANVSTVALVRATGGALAPELVDRIEAATLRPDAVSGRVAIANLNADKPIVGLGWTPAKAMPGPEIGAISVLTATDESARPSRLRRVCSLDELDPSVESDQIGLVVLTGESTRISSVEQVRDLIAASGWPLLGVLGDGGPRGGRR